MGSPNGNYSSSGCPLRRNKLPKLLDRYRYRMPNPNIPGKKSLSPASRQSFGDEVKLFLDPGALPDHNSLAFISKMLAMGKKVSISPIDSKAFKPVGHQQGTGMPTIPTSAPPNLEVPRPSESEPKVGSPDYSMPPSLKLELKEPPKVEPPADFSALQGFAPNPNRYAPPTKKILSNVQRSLTPPKPVRKRTAPVAPRSSQPCPVMCHRTNRACALPSKNVGSRA